MEGANFCVFLNAFLVKVSANLCKCSWIHKHIHQPCPVIMRPHALPLPPWQRAASNVVKLCANDKKDTFVAFDVFLNV